MQREKEEDEENELRSISFRPTTHDSNTKKFDASIVERSSQWAKMKDERIKRRRGEIEQSEKENCSFQPSLVNK